MVSIQVAGEALVDIVNSVAHPGGSPLNVAVGLGRLGHEVTLVTDLGTDEHGEQIAEHLRGSKVQLAEGSQADAPTSTATVVLDSSSNAKYEFDLNCALQHLRDTIVAEGAHTVAAVILETVVGTNGILVPPDGYLAGVRALCDELGILYIADEVMAGFGRCGEWFAVDRWRVQPDLVCFAKGVNSGYVPLGGVVLSPAVAATFEDLAFPGGLTYSGHPLACAAAVASIRIFREEGILEHVRELGETVIGPALRELADRHPSVGEVRGLGVFWALELVRDRTTREPLVPFNATGAAAAPMTEFGKACKAAGLWPFVHMNRTHVCPPCVITADEVHQGIAILDRALEVADRHTTSA